MERDNAQWRKQKLRILFSCILCLGLFVYRPVGAEMIGMPAHQQDVSQTHSRGVPDHDISYEDTLSPAWKSSWDVARQLYREKKYREALIQYEILLNQKDSVEEARWEYTSILMRLQRWEQATAQLEKLLAHDKTNRNYLFGLADASIACGQADKALGIYSRLHESALNEEETKRCLQGLVHGYEMQGNREAMLSPLEELLELEPDDTALQKKAAEVFVDLGYNSRAKALLASLEQHVPEDQDLIRLQARLHKKLGDRSGAVQYLQKLNFEDPDNFDAHRELKDYYRSTENWTEALSHLEELLKVVPDDADLLAEAAEFNTKLGRLDGALQYYEYALAIRPWDVSLRQKKKEAQQILARDLLVLVENDGTEKLWQDLVGVTADRPGIYREIATLLREDDQARELIEVLRLLYRENPSDSKTHAELSTLLKEQGRADELPELQANKYNTGVSQQ